jgi:hypothetical protein
MNASPESGRASSAPPLHRPTEPQTAPVVPLGLLADIHSGYAVSAAMLRAEDGHISLISGRDLLCGLSAPLQRIHSRSVPPHHFLRPGDLLLKLSGPHNPALLLAAPAPHTVCSAALCYVRIREPERLLPRYLEWFFNLPQTQAELAWYAHAGRIRPVGVRQLGVLLPGVACQAQIAQSHVLNQQISAMEGQLQVKRQRLFDEALWQLARMH